MNIELEPGKYILAVSGGVDSMSLLDFLVKRGQTDIVVAHFNHNIREDSDLDEQLVQKAATQLKLPLEIGRGNLGPDAGEDEARQARYQFLNQVKEKHNARAIVTAHHQDDLIETAFLNLLRGTYRRGLSAIADSDIVRPLLGIPKAEIISYAKANRLEWCEDTTNSDTDYARNYLRQNILKNLKPAQRRVIIGNIERVAKINKNINREIATISQTIETSGQIDRSSFIGLPHRVANELVADLLRNAGFKDFDRKTVERLSLSLKTGRPNTEQPVKNGLKLKIGRKSAHFITTD